MGWNVLFAPARGRDDSTQNASDLRQFQHLAPDLQSYLFRQLGGVARASRSKLARSGKQTMRERLQGPLPRHEQTLVMEKDLFRVRIAHQLDVHRSIAGGKTLADQV